jgi:hypothetical protein
MVVTVLVIGPGNGELIPAMLRLPRERGPWLLEQFRVHEAWIDARYRMPDAWAIVRVLAREHPAPPRTLPSRVTERFRVVIMKRSPNARHELLVDALAASVATHEHAFKWLRRDEEPPPTKREPADLDVEQMSFEAGIKPAIRLWLDREHALDYVYAYLRGNAAIAQVEFHLQCFRDSVFVMVARTLAEAEALADAEARTLQQDPARSQALRDSGQLLGFPPCCVEAFVDSMRFERRSYGESLRCNFHRLDVAWVPRLHPHLNTLRTRERIGLISFEPCRLDCVAALAIADRVAPLVEAACPGYGEALLGTFAIDIDNNRVELELADDRRVQSARPTHAGAESFAARIVGHHVDEQGRVPTYAEPCRVFEFVPLD